MRIRYSRPVLAALLLAACGGSTSAQAPSVAGTWTLRSLDRSPSLRLELIFDSTAGSTFRARVAFLMEGDVGIDPSFFQPGKGEMLGDTLLRVELRASSSAVPPSRIAGRLHGDTIVVRELVWTGDDRTIRGKRWILVR